MRFGINLRGDLAKLDDVEIASRFDALISETETQHRTLPAHVRDKLVHRAEVGLFVGRGLFHARVFYKIQAALFVGFGILPHFNLYLLDCELKDVRDEINRRVRNKKTAEATP
jgi:hypothetical protein